MNQDEQHLNLLSIFHYILGAITILGSFLFTLYIVMGILAITGGFQDKNPPPESIGLLFIIIGSLLFILGEILGILMIVVGKRLKEHKSRTFCIVIAAIECMLSPFGTILGVFTLIVLMRESVISLFAANCENQQISDL
jgi:hypothetical protein